MFGVGALLYRAGSRGQHVVPSDRHLAISIGEEVTR
jgi:hypothetical protein